MTIERLEFREMQDPDEVSGFCCTKGEGACDLEAFLKDDALTYRQRNLAKTYLAVLDGRVVGFFSLACCSVHFGPRWRLVPPESLQLSDVTHAIPGVMLARIAVDDGFRRNGVGPRMFEVAVAVAMHGVSTHASCRLLYLDAYENRQSWYEGLGCKVVGKARPQKEGPPVVPMVLDLFPTGDETAAPVA